MRVIRKKVSNGNTIYHECFNSYKEFYDVLMSRQANANQTIEQVFNCHNRNFLGIDSVEEAKDMLLKGWEKELDNIKKNINTELSCLEKRGIKTYDNVSGFIPIVPNAILGLPKSMIDVKQEPRKTRVLRFMISIDRACGVKCEEIVRKMSKQLAYIASLERSGKYRCRIEVFFSGYSGESEHDDMELASASILVKSENQLFDTKRLCYTIVHPSMLRLFMFSWLESVPLPKDKYYIYGYGHSFERWSYKDKKSFERNIKLNNEQVIVCDLNTNIEELLNNFK